MRADLAVGQQLAQVAHASIELAQRGTTIPDTVVVLSVPDEPTLITQARAVEGGVLFREPDYADAATSYAVVCDGAQYSDLRLAGGAMV